MVKIELQFTTVAEAVAFLTAGSGAAPAAVVTAAPASASKPKKETGAPKPDAKPQEDAAASGAQTATASAVASAQSPAPDEAPLPTYEKSGIGEKIQAHIGAKDTEGYTERRQQIVDLLAEFGVPSGKALKPLQFASFLAKLNALAGPEVALG